MLQQQTHHTGVSVTFTMGDSWFSLAGNFFLKGPFIIGLGLGQPTFAKSSSPPVNSSSV